MAMPTNKKTDHTFMHAQINQGTSQVFFCALRDVLCVSKVWNFFFFFLVGTFACHQLFSVCRVLIHCYALQRFLHAPWFFWISLLAIPNYLFFQPVENEWCASNEKIWMKKTKINIDRLHCGGDLTEDIRCNFISIWAFRILLYFQLSQLKYTIQYLQRLVRSVKAMRWSYVFFFSSSYYFGSYKTK